MPELPEVETYRRFLDELALHVPITGVQVLDAQVLTAPETALRAALVGRHFTASRRVGKNLLLELNPPSPPPPDGEPSAVAEPPPAAAATAAATAAALTLHFGMTGDVAAYRDVEDRPRFVRVELTLAGGLRIGFVDPRKFGRVGLTADVAAFLQSKNLGPDAYDGLTADHLAAALSRRKNALLKSALLDQRVTAGLGNWIVDEVLFQAQLHPARRAGTLSGAESARLHGAIGRVLRTAIDAEARYTDFPPNYLIHARQWEAAPPGATPTHCPVHPAEAIQKHYVGGRATYWCPVCQPAPAGWVAEAE